MAPRMMAIRVIVTQMGTYLDLVMPENDALKLINDFKNGTLKGVVGGGPYDKDGHRWVARADNVVAIHTLQVETARDGGVGLGADARAPHRPPHFHGGVSG